MHTDFYNVTATIIPILFLALTIQSSDFLKPSRLSRMPEKTRLKYVLGIVVILISLCFAEAVMLYAIYNSVYANFELSLFWVGVVYILIIAAASMIVLDYIQALVGKILIIPPTRHGRIIFTAIIVTIIAAGFLAGWYLSGTEMHNVSRPLR